MLCISTLQEVSAVTAPINYQNADPQLDRQINTTLYTAIKKILDGKRARGQDASITYYPGTWGSGPAVNF
jgi:hypothetical protein